MGLAKKRVIIHTKEGRSLEGILMRKRPELVLDLAEVLLSKDEQEAIRRATGTAEEKVQVKGRAVVLRENVEWIQVLR